MKTPSLEKTLREHPLLGRIPPRYLAGLRGCVTSRVFRAGEFLFRQGEASSAFYLIRRGSVRIEYPVEGDEPVVIQTLGEGDIVGWSWLLEPRTRHFDARAIDDARVLSFETDRLVDACETDHEMGFHLLRSFAGLTVHRLRATQMQLLAQKKRRPGETGPAER